MKCVNLDFNLADDLTKDEIVKVYFSSVGSIVMNPCSMEVFHKAIKTMSVKDALFETIFNEAVISALAEEVERRQKKVKNKKTKGKGKV